MENLLYFIAVWETVEQNDYMHIWNEVYFTDEAECQAKVEELKAKEVSKSRHYYVDYLSKF